MKKKSVLRRLLPWLITLALLAALVIFVGIPLYSQKEVVNDRPPVISFYEGGSTPIVLENDGLRFEMDPTTTQFTVTQKASGRVWRSNPADAAQDKIAVAVNKSRLQSTLEVSYSSADGTIPFNNYQYSIENGNFLIEQPDENTVRIVYSVGKIEKIYLLPTAITEERYRGFKEGMKNSDKKKLDGIYTLYTPEKAASANNSAELLAMYPELANQSLYIMKADTAERNKKSVADVLAAAGYTQEDYDLDMQLVAGYKESNDPVFNVTVEYRLEGDDLVVTVPYREIRYRADYPITSLTVLPMFGAAGFQDEGCMFVPEGGGALINYNNGKTSQSSYYANLYGWDYGSERTEVVSETKNTFPVFGMTREGGSFVCILEGATSYGAIQADISGRYNSYNTVSAKYTVIHSDRYNVSAKTARLVYMFEKDIPDDTVVQRYRFLESDRYVDMALAYGSYLREVHPELAQAVVSEDMPVSVELLGAIDKKVVKLGMPVDSVVATTTFKQAEEIMNRLADSGVKSMSVRVTGWSNGGINQKVLTGVRAVRELGGLNGMKSLIGAARNKRVPLYFDGVSCFAYRSGLLQGFIPFRDAARFTTREQIAINPYSSITYQPNKDIDAFYLVQPRFAQKTASNLIRFLKEQGAEGIAFRDIGYLLSGDYNPKDTTTREQVKAMNLGTLQEARAAGQKIIVKEGFDYVLPYVDLITDMDLDGIEYSILDASVPFYQIAIHGAVNYTGLPVNLGDDWQTEVLRCAEYGAGLNFTFMAENANVLQDTFHSAYYGSSFALWDAHAVQLITDYQAAMKGLNQTPITGHAILSPEVTVTEYANGAKVYVNYSHEDFQGDGVTIPARSYLVKGGESK